MRRKSVDALVEEARARLVRVTPEEAWALARNGAVLVDTRSDEHRRQDGAIPGALHYPLPVVLWRLDPDAATGNPKLPLDTHVILFCREGYSSTLAAAQLQEIGFTRATDMTDGFAGWQASGLPVEPSA